MFTMILITIAIAITLLLTGLAQLDRSRETVTDCANPGHCNDDYKGIRCVK